MDIGCHMHDIGCRGQGGSIILDYQMGPIADVPLARKIMERSFRQF
jgi:hypothetical protein